MSQAKPKAKPKARRRGPSGAARGGGDTTDRLALLADALRAHPEKPVAPRTAKLLAAGLAKMAQKVVEEAAEVAIDAVRMERDAVVRESADLLYNLTVLLTEMRIHPSEVWEEMDRRRAALGIAEKLPKPISEESPGDLRPLDPDAAPPEASQGS